MSKPKTKPIKPVIGFTKTAPTDLLARGNAVHTGMSANTADYPSPPVDMATLKAALDTYSSTITAALDGGSKAIAERNDQGEVVIKVLRQLAHYVEAACKDDVPTFLKSGFQPVVIQRAAAPLLSQFIRKIEQGATSGQLLVTIAAVPGALTYEVRWAPLGAGGVPGTWTTLPVAKTRPATSVTGLTPGTAYAFQVRSFSQSGYSDWSDSVTRMSM